MPDMTSELAGALRQLKQPVFKEGKAEIKKQRPGKTRVASSILTMAAALHGPPNVEAKTPLEIDEAARASFRPGEPTQTVEQIIKHKYEDQEPLRNGGPKSAFQTPTAPLSNVISEKPATKAEKGILQKVGQTIKSTFHREKSETKERQEQRNIFEPPVFQVGEESLAILQAKGGFSPETPNFQTFAKLKLNEAGFFVFDDLKAETVFNQDQFTQVSNMLNTQNVAEIYTGRTQGENLYLYLSVSGNDLTFFLVVGGYNQAGNFEERKIFGINKDGTQQLLLDEGEQEFMAIIGGVGDPIASILAPHGVNLQEHKAILLAVEDTADPKVFKINGFLGRDGTKRFVVEGEEMPPAMAGLAEAISTDEPLFVEAKTAGSLSENQAEWELSYLKENLYENQVVIFGNQAPAAELRGPLTSGGVIKLNGYPIIMGTEGITTIQSIDVQKLLGFIERSNVRVDSNMRLEIRYIKDLNSADGQHLETINGQILLVRPEARLIDGQTVVVKTLYVNDAWIQYSKEIGFSESLSSTFVVLLGVPIDATGDAFTTTDNRQWTDEADGYDLVIYRQTWDQLYGHIINYDEASRRLTEGSLTKDQLYEMIGTDEATWKDIASQARRDAYSWLAINLVDQSTAHAVSSRFVSNLPGENLSDARKAVAPKPRAPRKTTV